MLGYMKKLLKEELHLRKGFKLTHALDEMVNDGTYIINVILFYATGDYFIFCYKFQQSFSSTLKGLSVTGKYMVK